MTKKILVKPLAMVFLSSLAGCAQLSQFIDAPIQSSNTTIDGKVQRTEATRDPAELQDTAKATNNDIDLPPEDVWEVIRAGLTLDTHVDRRDVAQQIAFYSQHQSYLNRVATRATPFMYHIVRELEARELPT